MYIFLKHDCLFAHKYVLCPWLTGSIQHLGLCMALRGERAFYGSMGFQFSSHLNIKNNGLPK